MIKTKLKKIVSVVLSVAMVVTMLPMTSKESYAATGYDRGYVGGRYGNSTGTVHAEGLDISAWQGSSFDFQNVKNAGYDYVILRCGTTKGKDSCFETNYTKAKAAGLDVGAYYYSYATTVSAAKSDATNCLNWIAGKKFEYPIYFDYEDPSQESLSTTTAKNICLGFMDMVADEGYLVGMYTGQYKSTVIPTDEICAKYEFWVAHYYNDGLHASRDQAKAAISGMYQYTDSKYVNGVGPLDANVCYKDYPTIVKTYGFNGYSSEPAAMPTDKADHLSDSFIAKITYPSADRVLSIYEKYDIRLHTASDSNAQRWKFEKQSDGTYKITNVGYNQCMTALNSSSDSGTNIQLGDDDGSAGQRWHIYYLGNEEYVLQPACSTNTVMSIEGSSTDAGTNISCGTYYADATQKFSLSAILPTTTVDLGESFKAHITFDVAQKNLSIYEENDGCNVKLYDQTESEAQQWLFEKQTDGTYKITNVKYQQCMTVEGGASADGTNILLAADDGSTAQRWTILDSGSGKYIFRPACASETTAIMDVYGGNTESGTNIWIYSYNGSTAQEFSINKIEEATEETTEESSEAASDDSSEESSEDVSKDTTESSAEESTDNTTEKDTTESSAEESTDNTTEKDTTGSSAEESTDNTTEKDTVEGSTDESADNTTEKDTAKDNEEETTEQVEETSKESGEDVTNESEEETTEESGEDATDKSEETTEDSGEDVTNESDEESTEKPSEEETEKPTVDLKAEAKKLKISNFRQLTYEYGTTAVSIAWSKVANADGYMVYRALTKNGTYKCIDTISANSYRDRGLKGGSKYYYKVRAYRILQNQKVYGPYCEAKRMITKPDTPENFTVKAIGGKKVSFKWVKPSTTNGYVIYVATSRNGAYKTLKTLDSLRTSYTKTGLVKGRKYYFRLRAYRLDANGNKVYSGTSQIKTVTVK